MIAILEITSKGMVSMLVGTNSQCAVEAQVPAMVKSSGIVQILRSNRTPIRVVEGQEGAKVAMVTMKAMMMMTLAAAGVASQRMTLAVADVANQRRTLAAAGVAKRMTLAAADVANQRVAAAGVANQALAAAGAANLVDVVAGVSAESSWGTSVHHVHELG